MVSQSKRGIGLLSVAMGSSGAHPPYPCRPWRGPDLDAQSVCESSGARVALSQIFGSVSLHSLLA